MEETASLIGSSIIITQITANHLNRRKRFSILHPPLLNAVALYRSRSFHSLPCISPSQVLSRLGTWALIFFTETKLMRGQTFWIGTMTCGNAWVLENNSHIREDWYCPTIHYICDRLCFLVRNHLSYFSLRRFLSCMHATAVEDMRHHHYLASHCTLCVLHGWKCWWNHWLWNNDIEQNLVPAQANNALDCCCKPKWMFVKFNSHI